MLMGCLPIRSCMPECKQSFSISKKDSILGERPARGHGALQQDGPSRADGKVVEFEIGASISNQ